MALPSQTITKFLRENFASATPIVVTAVERATLIETIKTRLAGISHIQLNNRQWYRSEMEKARHLLSFSIEDPSDNYYYGNVHCDLLINEQNELLIRCDGDDARVSNVDEIFAFIAACQERLNRQHAQKQKRQKVRHLKAQAIVARVKKLAKEEKFDFASDTDTVKLNLYVKLSDKDCIELHIPFSKFEEVLPHLRATIQSLRELHARDIRFKLRSVTSVRWGTQWVKHESL